MPATTDVYRCFPGGSGGAVFSIMTTPRPYDRDQGFRALHGLDERTLLTQYLGELADHIIGECINPDRSDADVVAGLPSPSSAAERSG